jgi:hypothetical protein
MRYVLTVDFEDDADIEGFLAFVRYHSQRLKVPAKDVFISLVKEWKAQQASGLTSGEATTSVKRSKRPTD